MSNASEAGGASPLTFLVGLALSFGAILGLFLAANAHDPAMAGHGYLFVAFCTLGVFWMVKRHYDQAGEATQTEEGVGYNNAVVKAGCIASLFWGVVGLLAGL